MSIPFCQTLERTKFHGDCFSWGLVKVCGLGNNIVMTDRQWTDGDCLGSPGWLTSEARGVADIMVRMTRGLSMMIIGARVTLASHKGHSWDMISPQKITVCKAAVAMFDWPEGKFNSRGEVTLQTFISKFVALHNRGYLYLSKILLFTPEMWKNNNEIIRIAMAWNTVAPHVDFCHDDANLYLLESGETIRKTFSRMLVGHMGFGLNEQMYWVSDLAVSYLGIFFNHPDLLLANGARPHHILFLRD